MAILAKGDRIHSLSIFLFYPGLQISDGTHPQWWRRIIFAQSCDSHTDLFQNYPHRHTRKCFTSIWSSLIPDKLTRRINYHNPPLSLTSTVAINFNVSSCCWFPKPSFKVPYCWNVFKMEISSCHFLVFSLAVIYYLKYKIKISQTKRHYYIIYASVVQISAFSQFCHTFYFLWVFMLFSI